MVGFPSDCLDTIMDSFSGVRHISVAAIFRRWSLSRPLYDDHHHYSTAKRVLPMITALWGPGRLVIIMMMIIIIIIIIIITRKVSQTPGAAAERKTNKYSSLA